MKYTMLSLDPGYKNFAYTIQKTRINPKNDEFEYKILRSGCVLNTITTLTDSDILNVQHNNFLYEMEELIKQVSYIVLERYMTRGIKVGLTSECVNIMIGIILELARKLNKKVYLISATLWKNSFNSQYQLNLKEQYKWCHTSPHQLDSCLIGLFNSYIILERKPFYNITTMTLCLLMLDLEISSIIKLYKRRTVRLYFPNENI